MLQTSYQLTVDGSPVSPEVLSSLREIEVEDHADIADMLRLRFALAVSRDGSGWTLLDDVSFDRLSNIKVGVSVGARQRETLIDAYVVETRNQLADRPGESTIEVIAMDPTVLMTLDEKARGWPNMADSDIAEAVFGEYGFTPQVDQTRPTRDERAGTVMQRANDIQFLRQLARRNGFECYVEVNPDSGEVEGHFHAPRTGRPQQGVLSVNLGTETNVNRFSSRYEMMRPVQVQASGIEASGRAEQPASVTDTSVTELGDRAASAAERPRRVLVSQSGLSDTGELQTYAQAVVDRSAFAIRAEGELSTVTYGAILRAKRPVNVRGAGRQFSGTYYVERVLHRLNGDGYTQTFTLKRNARGVTGRERFTEDQALAS